MTLALYLITILQYQVGKDSASVVVSSTIEQLLLTAWCNLLKINAMAVVLGQLFPNRFISTQSLQTALVARLANKHHLISKL
jgi:hypothetical protein